MVDVQNAVTVDPPHKQTDTLTVTETFHYDAPNDRMHFLSCRIGDTNVPRSPFSGIPVDDLPSSGEETVIESRLEAARSNPLDIESLDGWFLAEKHTVVSSQGAPVVEVWEDRGDPVSIQRGTRPKGYSQRVELFQQDGEGHHLNGHHDYAQWDSQELQRAQDMQQKFDKRQVLA